MLKLKIAPTGRDANYPVRRLAFRVNQVMEIVAGFLRRKLRKT